MGSDAERLHLINRDPDRTTVDIRSRPSTGAANTHALYVQQAATSGAGQALVIESRNSSAPALTINAPIGAEGMRLNGALTISAVPGAPDPSTLPLGSTNAARSTGINLISSFAGGEDNTNGTDSTARINIYSYQRAQTHSFGEVQRMYAMRQDSKQMLAWYGWVNPDRTPGYDPVTREVAEGASCEPIAWIGAHIEANDHNSMHNHISIEVPDSTGALQTRFEILLGDRTTGEIGLDKSLIITNQSDFVVRCSNGQQLRLAAAKGVEKGIQFSNDSYGSPDARRWKIRQTATAETGSNAGSDYELVRYDDSGTAQSSTFIMRRDTGYLGLGAAVGDITSRLTVRQDGQVSAGFFVSTTEGVASTATLRVETATASKRAFDYRLTGDSVSRIRMDSSATGGGGTLTFGNGTTADTNLYRGAANLLQTDDTFRIGSASTLELGTTGDTNLYRVSGNALATDDSFTVFGNALGQATPANHNLVAWSYDPAAAATNFSPTSGTVYLTAVYIPRDVAVTKLYWHVVTAGVTPTAGQNEVGIYSSTGTKLASANVDADITSSGTKATTISSQNLTAGGMYWVAFVFNAATPPAIARGTGVTSTSTLANVGLTAATYRYAINGTSATALPTSITPASNAPNTVTPWVAVGV
ncbi:hypothetical protein ACPCIZ_12875 [Streptomyces cellulosae]